jgi:uncharacterized lipoprotein YmbA
VEIVSEVAPREFKVSELDRWMSPLGQGIREALIVDLAARLPAGRVISPHLETFVGTIGIILYLLEFHADSHDASLDVSWLGTADGTRAQACGEPSVQKRDHAVLFAPQKPSRRAYSPQDRASRTCSRTPDTQR